MKFSICVVKMLTNETAYISNFTLNFVDMNKASQSNMHTNIS